jgi:hypothetical protein
MMQGWIREVTRNLGGVSREERLKESYTRWTVHYEIKLYNS